MLFCSVGIKKYYIYFIYEVADAAASSSQPNINHGLLNDVLRLFQNNDYQFVFIVMTKNEISCYFKLITYYIIFNLIHKHI